MVGLTIACILTALFVPIVWCCMAERRHRNESGREKTAYLSVMLLWVGLVCGSIFLILSWICALQNGGVGVVICFSFFVLLCLGMMLGWRNCKIVYDQKGFTQYNILLMQRSFTYDQLTGYRLADGVSTDIKLYACGKTITIDMLAKNGIDFLVEARKGYARCNNGTELPNTWKTERKTMKQTGKGSFSAHVHNPGEFLAVFILLMLFMVGASVFCFVGMLQPIDPDDCQQMNLGFSSWKTDGDTLFLYSNEFEEPFKIGDYEAYMTGFAQLTEKCDGKTQFTAWAEYYDPDDGDPYYIIRELSADGMVFRTFADSTNAMREGWGPVVCLIVGLDLLLLLMSWMTYKVGCNPRKYPKWLVYALFKKSAISF